MIVFEDISVELLELLIAEGTAVVTIYGLLDAWAAVNVTTAGYVAVGDGVQADGALELGL